MLIMLNDRVDNGKWSFRSWYLNDIVDILEYEEDEVALNNIAKKLTMKIK